MFSQGGHGFQDFGFKRHLCPGGKLEFSGIRKPEKYETILSFKLFPINPEIPALAVFLRTNEIRTKRGNSEKSFQFGYELAFDKLYHFHIACTESSLELYFMDEYLFTNPPNYKTYIVPFNKVRLWRQNNKDFELKSLMMSESK